MRDFDEFSITDERVRSFDPGNRGRKRQRRSLLISPRRRFARFRTRRIRPEQCSVAICALSDDQDRYAPLRSNGGKLGVV
jgi:hypothetical protein